MKLEHVIAKMCTDALVGLGVLDKPKAKKGRPKGSKNKKKEVKPFSFEEWIDVKKDVDAVLQYHLKKREEKEYVNTKR